MPHSLGIALLAGLALGSVAGQLPGSSSVVVNAMAPNASASPAIQPRPRPLVFVKTHKTASSTIQIMVSRLAIRARLSCVPAPNGRTRSGFGCPNTLSKPPAGVPLWEVFAHHVVYEPQLLLPMMLSPRPLLISIVRDPVTAAASAYTYPPWKRARKRAGIPATFAAHAGHYSAKNFNLVGAPSSCHFRNAMAFDLGWYAARNFSTADDENAGAVAAFAAQIVRRSFHLVMVMEDLSRSTVLLWELLVREGWQLPGVELMATPKINAQKPSAAQRAARDANHKWLRDRRGEPLLMMRVDQALYDAAVERLGERWADGAGVHAAALARLNIAQKALTLAECQALLAAANRSSDAFSAAGLEANQCITFGMVQKCVQGVKPFKSREAGQKIARRWRGGLHVASLASRFSAQGVQVFR
ncbi:galactose-3-O-sulfotransferase-domain-containing protein [Pavlovales sp. CCMP2436]|nr:galactose-3-O-sulfotransferase-domain-containing protein [Pavlovales sp. CCMP2436]|mmetsp:Transcript_173/g.453  ORF Transcript_173/g.453 Transcript_173/m.453 type:complete len:415 (+) Transcript_173:169-1413(+)